MIVECTHCSTKFRVPDDRVGDAGTKVRCGRCSHTFQVFRSSDPAPSPTGIATGIGDDLFLGEPASPAPMPQTRRASPVMIESLLENDLLAEGFAPPPSEIPFFGTPGPPPGEMHKRSTEAPPSRFPDLSESSMGGSSYGAASGQPDAEELSSGFAAIGDGGGGDGGTYGGDGLGDIPGLLVDPFASMDMPAGGDDLAEMGLVIGPSRALASEPAYLAASSLDLPPSQVGAPQSVPGLGVYANGSAPQAPDAAPKSRGPIEFSFNETSEDHLSLELDAPSDASESEPVRGPSPSPVSRGPVTGSNGTAGFAQPAPSTGARSLSQPTKAPLSALPRELPMQDRRVWPTFLSLALGTALGVGGALQFGSQPAFRDAELGQVRSENVRLVHYPTKFGTRLWVVTGEAKNQGADPMLGIQAEVSLHDGPKSLAERKVWLGVELPVNVLYGIGSEADLASAYQAAEERLQLPVAAVQVLPNASERFMAVFAAIPDGAAEDGMRPAVDVRFVDRPKSGSPEL